MSECKKSNYLIEHYEYGILIIGKVPTCDIIELLKIFRRIYGYDECDALIANHYSATICLTNEYQSNMWRSKLTLK